MASKTKVIVRIKKDGKASYEISGAPGEQCLDVKSGIAPILANAGLESVSTEATDEMHIHAGKPSEAHNNV